MKKYHINSQMIVIAPKEYERTTENVTGVRVNIFAPTTNPKRRKMSNEDYVSYELAKKLKACGFDEPCDHYWYKVYTNSDEMGIRQGKTMDYNNDDWFVPHCSAPTLWHAQKWLREKKHISVRVSYLMDSQRWLADWLNLDSGEFDDTDATFSTYEEALADGISNALDLLAGKEGKE